MSKHNDLLRRLACIALSVIMTIVCVPFFGMQEDVVHAVDEDLTEEYATGGMGESAPAVDTEVGGRLRTKSDLPASYDSRKAGNVTPVRDQNPLGTCWAFATIAAVESSLLAHGQVSSAEGLDLSERQLAYFSYNLVTDKLTAGDKNIPKKLKNGDYLNNDGNAWITSQIMASGIGIVNETDAPSYQDLVDRWNKSQGWSDEFNEQTKLEDDLARGANSWSISSVKRIPVSNEEALKQAVIDNGGVAVLTLLATGKDHEMIGLYWNEENAAYYNKGFDDCNHLVTIIGWNDDYPAENFRDPKAPTKLPSENGAWLCKNSYGADWGKGGYYWLSYEDRYFASGDVSAYAFEMRPASRREIMYQYDGASGECYINIPSGGSVANMFTTGGSEAKDQTLKSVRLSIMQDAEVDYSIQIYTDCEDADDPESGEPALTTPISGTTGFPGIYTIDLDEKITLKDDSRFAVVATLSHGNGDDVKYDVDSTSRCGWVEFESSASEGRSYEKANGPWEDMSEKKCDNHDGDDHEYTGCEARIKAIAETAGTDISGANVKAADAIYSGKELEPEVRVSLNGQTLVKGRDYDAVYENNINAGKATVTVTGKGDFEGQARGSFIIRPKTVTPAVQLSADKYSYNGKTRKPAVTVKDGSTKLSSSQYSISYPKTSRNVGIYTVSVTLKGNYSGTGKATFRINPKGTSLTGLTGGKKKITVRWKKQSAKMASSKITGYQIQYSTKKNFKSGVRTRNVTGAGKTSCTVSSLRTKKTYYVRVRTYKTVKNGTASTKLYSPWSKSRSVRTG